MTDQQKISELEKSNAKMFDTIISMGEQITHFEKVFEELRKENEELKKKIYE